jgi:hypothetical protein
MTEAAERAHRSLERRLRLSGTDDRAFGAEDVAGASTPGQTSENYVL